MKIEEKDKIITDVDIRFSENEYLILTRLCHKFKKTPKDMIRMIVKEVLHANKK